MILEAKRNDQLEVVLDERRKLGEQTMVGSARRELVTAGKGGKRCEKSGAASVGESKKQQDGACGVESDAMERSRSGVLEEEGIGVRKKERMRRELGCGEIGRRRSGSYRSS